MKKKLIFYSELVYIFSLVILSFAVAMISATDFGLSMIVSPAFLISEKFSFITFGQAEYIVQGILFIVMCMILRKVRAVYFSSFVTGFLYGLLLDMWRVVVPHFNPEITPAGSLPIAVRVVYFILGMMLTAISIALCFRTYLCAQVYDFFVKAVCGRYNLNSGKFKTVYDFVFLALSVIMSFAMFGKFVGIGFGTIIMALFNGTFINFFGKVLDRIFDYKPIFKKFSKYFKE